MIKSPYATKYTRDQQSGSANPSRDMANRKAQEEPKRKAAWQRRMAENKG